MEYDESSQESGYVVEEKRAVAVMFPSFLAAFRRILTRFGLRPTLRKHSIRDAVTLAFELDVTLLILSYTYQRT